MKTHMFAILCIAGLMLWNMLVDQASRAAQVELLAHEVTNTYQIDNDEAWDFFWELSSRRSGLMMLIDSMPYLTAIAVLVIMKRKKLLHD